MEIMLTRKTMLTAFTGIAAFVAIGCNNQPRASIQPHGDSFAEPQINVDSYELQRDVAVGQPIRSRDAAGLLHIVVPVRSIIDRQLHVQYRVQFIDRNHSLVNEIGWTDKTLAANTPDQVDANSTSPAADDFRVHFRYPPGY
jgi:hypothetical protein